MLARRLEQAVKLRATATRAVSEKAYLESELIHYGVAMPLIRAETKGVEVADRAELREVVKNLSASQRAALVTSRDRSG